MIYANGGHLPLIRSRHGKAMEFLADVRKGRLTEEFKSGPTEKIMLKGYQTSINASKFYDKEVELNSIQNIKFSQITDTMQRLNPNK